MTDFSAEHARGHDYGDFLGHHASDEDRERWQRIYDRVTLTESHQAVLASFVREMKVLVLAGAWCGDCVNQCPIWERFSQSCSLIQVRYLDRDENPELTCLLYTSPSPRD